MENFDFLNRYRNPNWESKDVFKNNQEIFLSYSRDDKEIADQIYERLIKKWYPVWMDKKLEAAKEWEPQIEDHLRKSDRFIVLISANSINSKWVNHEGSMAYTLRHHIIPLHIDGFENYSAEDLPIWVQKIQLAPFKDKQDNYENGFLELFDVLGEPIPLQILLDRRLEEYKERGVLLDEVTCKLIQANRQTLVISDEAEDLIRESEQYYLAYADKLKGLEKRLDETLTRVDDLEKDLQNERIKKFDLEFEQRRKIQQEQRELFITYGVLVFLILLCIIIAIIK